MLGDARIMAIVAEDGIATIVAVRAGWLEDPDGNIVAVETAPA